MICRECGCTDAAACPRGCSWAEPDLCSACAQPKNDQPTCDLCGRARRDDEPAYDPFVWLAQNRAGWYSGDDGELCPSCLSALIQRANHG